MVSMVGVLSGTAQVSRSPSSQPSKSIYHDLVEAEITFNYIPKSKSWQGFELCFLAPLGATGAATIGSAP
ncbi:hypothetical protein [Chroococcidiopsis cubana]|uniref:hypothetical protein n=1 Tax=Chroococcidiopsis cubana TaxID=171392 RepID=UPI000F8EDE61|nr:hypothetical protein [Chroococcidiopsis cubana]